MSRVPAGKKIIADERVGKDAADLRHWRERALRELEAKQLTVLAVEESGPETVRLD